MAYSKGIIAIPNVSGNIEITVQTTAKIGYTNLFDKNASYDTASDTRWYTNWMPYTPTADGQAPTFHIKGAVPYKFTLQYTNGTNTADVYAKNAEQIKPDESKADYDSTVSLFQHSNSNVGQFAYIRFMFDGIARDTVADSLIITANQKIIDE